MTDNTMDKKKGQRDKQRFTKTLHRKLKIIFIFIFYDGKMDTTVVPKIWKASIVKVRSFEN
jgi:hypothetical protein